MKTISVLQGSPDWLAVRAKHFTASEAPAMLGLSKYMSRNELLRQKSTGIAPDVDDRTQRLFDRGHEAENAARSIVEERIGEELYPVTGSLEVEGLPLLASFDGISMDDETVWENKLWNDSLIEDIAVGELGDHYWPQLEQQLLVSGANKAYFTASDGTPNNTIGMWYQSIQKRRQQLIAGWKQFAIDLANFQPVDVAPAAVAAPIKDLPTLFIQARGEVTKTNMPEFKAKVTEFIGSINMKPATDQEFADGKEVARKLRELAVKIKERKADMLAQTATIGEVAVEIDNLAEIINSNALELEKTVKREEEARKLTIVSGGRSALAEHIAVLNKRLGRVQMPAVQADFAEAIKGKRLLTAMKNAVDTTLANAKIAANEIADKIQINLATLDENKEHAFLFNDLASLVMKAPEDLSNVIKLRISEHAAEQQRKLDAEREKIRKEEESKAQAVAKAEQDRIADEVKPGPVIAIVPEIRPAYTVESGTLIKLGEICSRLNFTVTADFLDSLGFPVVATDNNAKLYSSSSFKAICAGISAHVLNVGSKTMAKAA